MKRLALILTVLAFLLPAPVFAQGAGAFMDGFNRGMAQSRGQYVPPPQAQQPTTSPQSGTLYGPNGQTYLYQMNPGGNSGTIYGPNGQTWTIQGNK